MVRGRLYRSGVISYDVRDAISGDTRMEYRRLGESDVEVTQIIFGAWAVGGWMWGGTDAEAGIAAIRRSVEMGITTIDTAAIYGMGRSEEIVGRAIEPLNRDELQILTKFGMRWDLDADAPKRWDSVGRDGKPCTIKHWTKADSVIRECEDSLRRLGIDTIDLFQQHWPDPGTPVEECMGALETLIRQGKIRAAGTSNFTADLLERARAVVPIASNQPPYSMVNRAVEADVLPYCRDNGISTIVYSPMQRGLLTGKITPDYVFHGDDHRAKNPLFHGENLTRVNAFLDEIRPIADAHNATLAQLAVNWTLAQDGVTAALVGARNPAQAEENAHAAEFTLADDETARINELLDQLTLDCLP